MRSSRFISTTVVGIAAFVAACADAPTTAPATNARGSSVPSAIATSAVVPTTGVAAGEQFKVCKTGSAANFSYTIDYNNPSLVDEAGTFSLNDGDCVLVAGAGGVGASVSVTEVGAPAGYTLDRVDVTSVSGTTCSALSSSSSTVSGPTVSGTISGTAGGTLLCRGILAHYYNKVVPPTGEIGNFVWNDLNQDGIQDAGEPGIPGILVTLGGDASATATTDASGYYLFSGLPAGNYTVQVGAGPATYVASPANAGSDDALDSDGTGVVNVTLPTNSSVDLTIDFGFYAPPPPSGCTRTIGYWKTHAGFTGNNADVVTQYLPIWLGTANGAKSVQVTTATQAVSVLSMTGGASNGIVKLMAQLLGAKLSIAAGADGSAVAATISAADAFLAQNNAAGWSSLTQAKKAQVNGWMTTLDNYNNGLIGPAHCE